MLQQSTKDAIKIALAVTLSICIALLIEWEKAYWAGISALVMGMSESFGHALNKGRNRIYGTILGATSGIILIGLFSQDRFWFLAGLTLLLAVCVFMASHKKYGYIATICFIVCLIVSSVGGFDSATTFNVLLLRLQETFLGVIIYSMVYRFLWPKESEVNFFLLYAATKKNLLASYELLRFTSATQLAETQDSRPYLNNYNNIQMLHDLLNMPLKGSYQLYHHHHQWKDRVKAMFVAQYFLSLLEDELLAKQSVIKNHRRLLTSTMAYLKASESSADENFDHKTDHGIDRNVAYTVDNYQQKKAAYKARKRKSECPQRIVTAYQHLPDYAKSNLLAKKDYATDAKKALKAVCIFASCLLIWIYLPIPDSYMFPMNAGVFACILAAAPDNAVKDWMIGYFGFGILYLAQYILILPGMSEVWQLSAVYFVNIFLLWKVFARPKYFGFRVIGGNLLMTMTTGALQLTPVYDVQNSIEMIVFMMLGLIVTQFYIHLFSIRKISNA